MSTLLLKFAGSFVNERLSANDFANAYIELWRIQRDMTETVSGDLLTSGVLSSIFCLADLYNPDSDKEEYELDETQLREKVAVELGRIPAGGGPDRLSP